MNDGPTLPDRLREHAATHSDSKDLLNAAADEIESYRTRASAQPNPNGPGLCDDPVSPVGTVRCVLPLGHEGAHVNDTGKVATVRWISTSEPERELYRWVEGVCDAFPLAATVLPGTTITVGPHTVQVLHDALAEARRRGRWL